MGIRIRTARTDGIEEVDATHIAAPVLFYTTDGLACIVQVCIQLLETTLSLARARALSLSRSTGIHGLEGALALAGIHGLEGALIAQVYMD